MRAASQGRPWVPRAGGGRRGRWPRGLGHPSLSPPLAEDSGERVGEMAQNGEPLATHRPPRPPQEACEPSMAPESPGQGQGECDGRLTARPTSCAPGSRRPQELSGVLLWGTCLSGRQAPHLLVARLQSDPAQRGRRARLRLIFRRTGPLPHEN